jgi:hypothetical protein
MSSGFYKFFPGLSGSIGTAAPTCLEQVTNPTGTDTVTLLEHFGQRYRTGGVRAVMPTTLTHRGQHVNNQKNLQKPLDTTRNLWLDTYMNNTTATRPTFTFTFAQQVERFLACKNSYNTIRANTVLSHKTWATMCGLLQWAITEGVITEFESAVFDPAF